MTINKGNLVWLCFAWAALILLGLTFSVNIPLILAIVGTILYLLV